MITIAAAGLGAIAGALSARRRGGSRLDIAQYAAVYALIFGLIGLFVSVFLMRG